MDTINAYLRKHWLWLLVQVVAITPLLVLSWNTLRGNLSINPIDDFTNLTGTTAILFLLASLAVTPINTATGWRQITTVRKTLGLWAFAYAVLHFFVFVGLDYGFNLEFILADGLPSKPYIVVGFAALLILLPLAITSTKGWQKRLRRTWKKLHRWVYAAGILAVIHYIWVAKVAFGKPTLYATILAVLLVARVPVVRTWLSKLRPTRSGRGAKPARKSTPEIARA